MSTAGIESWTFPVGVGRARTGGPVRPRHRRRRSAVRHRADAGRPDDGPLRPGGIAPQTDQVLANLAGLSNWPAPPWTAPVQVRAYLADFALYDEFNRAYRAWFPDRLPSRTCIGVNGLALGALVEIDLVVVRPPQDGERIEPPWRANPLIRSLTS